MARKRHKGDNAKDENSLANDLPRKRAKTYNEEDAVFARIYDDLANEVGEKRVKASARLVRKLFDGGHAQRDAVNTALARLIRGLCSGRKAARLGFSVAFTEVLRQMFDENAQDIDISPQAVIKLVHSITQADKSFSGQEKRDYLLGRVFGYKALILSKGLFRNFEDPNLWRDVVHQLCQLAAEIPWLREECGIVLFDAAQIASEDSIPDVYTEILIEMLCQKRLYQTPQGVAIWLSIKKNNPDMKLPKGIWHHQDPLSSKERGRLATIMREDYSHIENDAKGDTISLKSGLSLPQISFAWDVIFTHLIHDTDTEREKLSKNFSKFWNEVVDENLFASTASLERKAWGFQVFSRAIRLLPEWALSFVFSLQLMKCLINHRADPKRYLYNASKLPFDAIRSRAKNEPSVADLFVYQLTGPFGAFHFDELTNTKILEELLGFVEPEALTKIIFYFSTHVMQPTADNHLVSEMQRRVIADLFLSILRRQSKINASLHDLTVDRSWLKELLNFLLRLVFFKFQPGGVGLIPEPDISEASKDIFRNRLFSCLTCIMERKLDEDDYWIHYVVNQMRVIQKKDSSWTQDFTNDEKLLKRIRKCHNAFKILFGHDEEDVQLGEVVKAFRLLYSLSLLQLYNGEPDAITIMEDLEESFRHGPQRLMRDSRAMMILVDVVIGALSKSTVLSRLVATRCFTAMTNFLTEDALGSFFEVLGKPENVLGQNEVYAQEGSVDGHESNTGGDEESEGGSDVETSAESESGEDVSDDVEEVEITNEGKDASQSSDNEEDDEELSKFNSLLADVLQVQAKGEAGKQDGSSDESDMDDEQMMALDSHLTNVFKERKKVASRKREHKDAKQTMIVFKNRILDLLLIYIRNQHTNPLSVTLILPLLHLMRTTSSKQLAEKAFNHLKQYCDTCKSKGMPREVRDEVLWGNLKTVHEETAKATSKMLQSACSRSSLFISKLLVLRDKKNYDGVVEQYASSQKSWYMDPKSKINPTMFTEWISWSIGTRTRK